MLFMLVKMENLYLFKILYQIYSVLILLIPHLKLIHNASLLTKILLCFYFCNCDPVDEIVVDGCCLEQVWESQCLECNVLCLLDKSGEQIE